MVPNHSNVNGPIPPEITTSMEPLVPQDGWTIVGDDPKGMNVEFDEPGVGAVEPVNQTSVPSHSRYIDSPSLFDCPLTELKTGSVAERFTVTPAQPPTEEVVKLGVCANCPPPQYKPSRIVPDEFAKANCSELFVKIPT